MITGNTAVTSWTRTGLNSSQKREGGRGGGSIRKGVSYLEQGSVIEILLELFGVQRGTHDDHPHVRPVLEHLLGSGGGKAHGNRQKIKNEKNKNGRSQAPRILEDRRAVRIKQYARAAKALPTTVVRQVT